MNPTDDRALLCQFVENHSDEAFAALVTRYINLVYSVALRQVGNPHQAEETTQAVFIILAKKAAQLRYDKALSSWLFQATRLTAHNLVRSEIRRRRREQEAHMQTILNESGRDIWQRIAPWLDAAVAALGEKDRRAIVLRFYEGRNLREVGAALGASEDAAEKRVARALEKLRKFFGKRGVSSTAATLADTISANSRCVAPAGLAKAVSAVAVTKGATASTSIPTVIKGALKIMAWTKAKTAIVFSAGILLATGTTTLMVDGRIHPRAINDAVWNDDPKALNAAPPTVILRPTRFPANRAGGILLPENGKLAIRHEPFDMLLENAFNWSPARMVVKTKLPEGFFDYLVTLPEDQDAALQKKIRQEFGIIGRHEVLDTKVYLVKADGQTAAGIKPPRPGSFEEIDQTNGVVKGPLSRLWFTLESYLHVPIEPAAGLDERHNVEFHWNQLRHEAAPGTKVDVDELKRLMRDQLGLELIATNMPIKMLVVEKAK